MVLELLLYFIRVEGQINFDLVLLTRLLQVSFNVSLQRRQLQLLEICVFFLGRLFTLLLHLLLHLHLCRWPSLSRGDELRYALVQLSQVSTHA